MFYLKVISQNRLEGLKYTVGPWSYMKTDAKHFTVTFSTATYICCQ
jgi:hypothetical protein